MEKIFLNADGQKDDVGSELKAFLDYVAGRESDDPFIKKVENAVRNGKKNREWRREYMMLMMRDQENIEKGREEGELRLSLLIKKLVKDSRMDDVLKASEDKVYRQKLYQEYHIE